VRARCNEPLALLTWQEADALAARARRRADEISNLQLDDADRDDWSTRIELVPETLNLLEHIRAREVNLSTRPVERARQHLGRRAFLVPTRRRLLVQQTQQDLMRSEPNEHAIENRTALESNDLWLDAIRSRIGVAPGKSLKPIAIGLAFLASVGGVAGVQITGEFHLNAQFALQLAATPVWALIALASAAAAIVIGRRRTG